jgi:imidazole glycerol-phosphate synthase subunit HisF
LPAAADVLATRVIPCLLLKGAGLVKTVRFKDPKYVGDPINAVKIFNEKEVDELIFLDITASRENKEPPFAIIEDIASECFMPVAYGGGVTSVEQAARIISLGIEKIVLNTAALRAPDLVTRLSDRIGASSTVVGIDVKKDLFGRYRVYDHPRQKTTDSSPAEYATRVAAAGAGEIFLNDVIRDGTGAGFDLDLVRSVTAAVDVPVIVCGGAGGLDDLRLATTAGASAVAAGSLFVYMGKHRAVMINYPPYAVLQELFQHG